MSIKPGEIPISDAADICKRRGCAYVIVFGVRADGEKFHITSYGKTRPLCKLAGSMANQIADAVLDGKVATPDHEPGDWIEQASEGIRCRWLQWEQEAGQISASQQDNRLGEEYLFQCLSNYLRHMQAMHSKG